MDIDIIQTNICYVIYYTHINIYLLINSKHI